MCGGRGHKNKNTQTKLKKKLTCRQRCARRCRQFCCNRIKRCIKKKIFGVPEPLADFDFDKDKSKLKLNASGSFLNTFTNALQNKDSKGNTSIKNIAMNDIIVNELKRKYSIKGSKEKVLNNMINDYTKGKLSVSQLQETKLNLKNLNKNQVHNMLKDYEATQKEKYVGLNAKDLKKKFNVNKSQEKVLGRMVDDLKKGKLSATAITNANGFDPNELDKDKLNNMLHKYETRPSFVAKKFAIKGSREKILSNFLKDYDKGKISATKFVNETGFKPNKLNKNQLNDILKKYDAEQKAKLSESKGKLQKLMDDLKSIANHPSIIDQAKKYLK